MEDMVKNFDLCSIEENSFRDFVQEQLFFYQGKNINMRNLLINSNASNKSWKSIQPVVQHQSRSE